MRKAFALAMVLWISAILMASTVYLLSIYKRSVNNAQKLNDKLHAELLSDSYIDKFKFYALTGRFKDNYIENDLNGFPNKLFLDNTTQYTDKNVTFSLRAGGEMFSLYSSNAFILEKIVKFYTNDDLNYKDPYLDWIDLDSNMLLNGAESSFYNLQSQNYSCSNMGTIQHPEELFYIKNFSKIDEQFHYEIVKNFHNVNHSKINPSVITPKVVKKFVNVSEFDLNQLKILNKNDYNQYVDRLKFLLRKNSLEDINVGSSYIVDLIITVKQHNSTVSKKINLYLNNFYKRPYMIYKYYLIHNLSKKKI